MLENKNNKFFSAISTDFMNQDQIKPSAFTQQWKIGKPAQMICSDTIVLWLLWLGIMTMFQMRKYLDLIHRIFWLTSKYLWSDAVNTKFNSWSFRYVLIMDSFPSKLQPNLQSLIKDPAQLTKQKMLLDTKCIWNQIHWLQVLKKKPPQVIGLGSYHGQWRVYRESDNF